MEPIYGNHLGIVVNREDPEGRKRVQVFIPHLSNTLYDQWNALGEDKSFKDINELGPTIISKLKQILPWAEMAAPFFGGGTPITSNTANGRTTVNNSGQSPVGPVVTPANGINNGFNNSGQLTQNSSGSNPKSSSSYQDIAANALATASANGTLISVVNNTPKANTISADANGSPASYKLEGSAGNLATGPMTYANGQAIDGMKTPFLAVENSSDVGKWFAVSLNKNPPVLMLGVDPSTSGGNGGIIGSSSAAGVNNYHGEPSVAGLIAMGGGVSQDSSGLLTGTTLNMGDTMTIAPVNDPSLQTFSVNNKPTQEQLDAIANSQLTDSQINQLDGLVANATENGGQNLTAGAQEPNAFDPLNAGAKNIAAASTPNINTASGAANGVISIPKESAKVWVFFHGGDVQRPVYFACTADQV